MYNDDFIKIIMFLIIVIQGFIISILYRPKELKNKKTENIVKSKTIVPNSNITFQNYK